MDLSKTTKWRGENGNANANADAKVSTIALPVLCTGELKLSKHHTFARIVTLATQIIIIWLCKQLGEQCIL